MMKEKERLAKHARPRKTVSEHGTPMVAVIIVILASIININSGDSYPGLESNIYVLTLKMVGGRAGSRSQVARSLRWIALLSQLLVDQPRQVPAASSSLWHMKPAAREVQQAHSIGHIIGCCNLFQNCS